MTTFPRQRKRRRKKHLISATWMLHCRYTSYSCWMLITLTFSVVCLVIGDLDTKAVFLCFYSWLGLACEKTGCFSAELKNTVDSRSIYFYAWANSSRLRECHLYNLSICLLPINSCFPWHVICVLCGGISLKLGTLLDIAEKVLKVGGQRVNRITLP